VSDAVGLELRTRDAAATRAMAAALAPLCRPGDVLLLAGDLGAGKTTFAQGFGAGLGVTEAITSPTFTLVRHYPIDRPGPGARASGLHRLLHADVYRLDHLHEVVDLGLAELVEDGSVALVEWGDAAAPVLGGDALDLRLETDADDDGQRLISIRPEGEAWTRRWEAVRSALAPWRIDRRIDQRIDRRIDGRTDR
jgi:tRNA threonylcarbamoyladenosine biosynthesis protein TsaE